MSSPRKPVSNTHCYVYDPTSHEESYLEDSSKIDISDRMQASHSKSDQQSSRQSKPSDKSGHSSSRHTSSKTHNSTRHSGSSSSKERSSAKKQEHSSRGSRSQASGDRGGRKKDDDFIWLSDDSPSPTTGRSRDRQRRRSRSPRKRSRSGSGSQSGGRPEIIVKDFRCSPYKVVATEGWLLESSSSSRSRDRQSHQSRSKHRSRSRSADKRRRSGSSDRHRDRQSLPLSDKGSHSRLSEMQKLKDRIEKLKAEIHQTRKEKDSYLQRESRARDDESMHLPVPARRSMSPAPYVDRRPPSPYSDRERPVPRPYDDRARPPFYDERLPPMLDFRKTDEWIRHNAEDIRPSPPQRVEQFPSSTVDVPRDVPPRDYRPAEALRAEVKDYRPSERPAESVRDKVLEVLPASKQPVHAEQPTRPEPRTR